LLVEIFLDEQETEEAGRKAKPAAAGTIYGFVSPGCERRSTRKMPRPSISASESRPFPCARQPL